MQVDLYSGHKMMAVCVCATDESMMIDVEACGLSFCVYFQLIVVHDK